MSEKYFKVREDPEVWANKRGICSPVVTMAPWENSSISLGGVSIEGRKSWNATTPIWGNEVIYYNTYESTLRSILNNIVVHHTNNSRTVLQNEKRQQGRGYAALGYHFFIDKKGKVFEGRPLEIMGGHAGKGSVSGPLNDPDWGSVGIVLQGDYHHKDDWFSSEKATKIQLDQLEKLVIALKGKYNINRLLMHREVKRTGDPTVCPGDHLVPHVIKLRKKLGMKK
jgi:N-acetyl-anhydromuramyl-L-alanine amidase AmpD